MSQGAGVAIVGMSVFLPGAPDLDTYWNNLRAGVDAVSDVPASRWDPFFYEPLSDGQRPPVDRVYCRRGGFVAEPVGIDVARYGIPPSAVAGIEPDQLIALSVAAAAIEDAGGEAAIPARAKVGVILGRGGYVTPAAIRFSERVRGSSQLIQTLRELLPDTDPAALAAIRRSYHDALGPYAPENAIGLVSNLAASRLANRLDLRGPAYTVDGACASSLIAVDQAVSLLRSGRCDAVLAGGVHHCHDISFWSVFAQMRALSASQQIRPFDRNADGTLIGEGTGMVVLRRLEDAVRDGARVYAVIRGVGVASDGRTTSLMNPDPAGQARAVQQAWDMAGLDPGAPGSVGLLEAHGTATQAGDTAEIRTMARTFGQAGPPAVIGSVKSMIGHTMPTAGVAGLVKAALALHRQTLLPTLHCAEPHAELAKTRFRPLAAAAPWPEVPGQPRRAALNAFGFGGINAHVVMEEAPRPDSVASAIASPPPSSRRAVDGAVDVLRLAAGSQDDLLRMLDADDASVRAAGLAGSRRDGAAFRLAIADPGARTLALARRIVSRGEPWRGQGGIWFTGRPLLTAAGGRLALLFPGLDVGFQPRLDDLTRRMGLAPVSADVTSAASHGLGVLRVGLVLHRALTAAGVRPDAVAGYSIGEWSAMLSAHALPQDQAEALLAVDPSQVQVTDLVFAAVGMSAETVLRAVGEPPGVVVSHDNAPGQSVICGPASAIRAAAKRLRGSGVLLQELPFRSGFHTPMFAPHVPAFRSFFEQGEVRAPRGELWSATTGTAYDRASRQPADVFLDLLTEPVRFRSMIEAMYQAGFRVFVQAGLGQLPGLVDEILAEREHLAVAAASAHRDGLPQLRRVLAALWTEGHPVAITGPEAVAAPRTADGKTRQRTAGPRVPLDLGTTLVSFVGERLRAMREAITEKREAVTETAARRPGEPGPALAASGRTAQPAVGPVASELRELLADMDQAAGLALTALRSPPASSAAPAPAPPSPPVPAPPPVPSPVPQRDYREVLRVSTESMPYLRDHCFFRQRPGWPDESDRRPVMPATTIIWHMVRSAEKARPGQVVTEISNLQLMRWLAAAPPVDVPVTVRQAPGEATARIVFGEFSTASVTTAAGYPARRPPRWSIDRAAERLPPDTAAQMYEGRLMFHGPAFQGVTDLSAMGPRHIRGIITTPRAPGALLDCAGQILGYWIIKNFTSKTRVLPVRLARARYWGPPPPAGTPVECHTRIVHIDEDSVTADIQLARDGLVWAELSGWRNRRFDNHPETQAVENFPEYRSVSRAQPGGWMLLFERWNDLASRDLVMRNHLGAAERAEFEACAPPRRRHWLLGRVAAKDAVRTLLWEQGEEAVFPAEVRVRNDPSGQPQVSGMHGRKLPPLSVSVAHCGEAAVAMVRSEASGGAAGIDVEEVTDRPASLLDLTLAARERDLLATLADRTGESVRLWFTRLWAAKEAAAKAVGTGLQGQPRRFQVRDVRCPGPGGRECLAVTVPGAGQEPPRDILIRFATIRNPPDLPPREYVVAWTP